MPDEDQVKHREPEPSLPERLGEVGEQALQRMDGGRASKARYPVN